MSHSLVGCRQDRRPFWSQPNGGRGLRRATCRHPGNPTAADHRAPERHSTSRAVAASSSAWEPTMVAESTPCPVVMSARPPSRMPLVPATRSGGSRPGTGRSASCTPSSSGPSTPPTPPRAGPGRPLGPGASQPALRRVGMFRHSPRLSAHPRGRRPGGQPLVENAHGHPVHARAPMAKATGASAPASGLPGHYLMSASQGRRARPSRRPRTAAGLQQLAGCSPGSWSLGAVAATQDARPAAVHPLWVMPVPPHEARLAGSGLSGGAVRTRR